MSKPKATEWEVHHWSIEYRRQGFDLGDIGPDPVDWCAFVTWSLPNYPEVKAKHFKQPCRTYNEARAWIEEETGLRYAQFSEESD